MNFIRRIPSSVRSRGVMGMLDMAGLLISCAWYDRYFGVATTSRPTLPELGIENPLFNDYAPTFYPTLMRCLKALGVRPSDVFVDFGCGAGRAMIVAATRPFRRVLGVEIAPQLVETARENLRRASRRLVCKDISIVQGDATSWEIPADLTVAFFYSPFRGEVLRSVFENLRRSIESHPRQVTILYHNPPDNWQEEAACDWTELVRVHRGYIGKNIHVYRALAPACTGRAAMLDTLDPEA